LVVGIAKRRRVRRQFILNDNDMVEMVYSMYTQMEEMLVKVVGSGLVYGMCWYVTLIVLDELMEVGSICMMKKKNAFYWMCRFIFEL
jgi:hypothetical protein